MGPGVQGADSVLLEWDFNGHGPLKFRGAVRGIGCARIDGCGAVEAPYKLPCL